MRHGRRAYGGSPMPRRRTWVAGKSWTQAGASGRRCGTVAMRRRSSKRPAGWR